MLAVILTGLELTVLASGSQNTGGSYTDGAMIKYGTERYVADPSLPGPEVAFYLSSYSPGLYLGTWNCVSGYDGPIYYQVRYSWNPVAYYSSPRWFCVITWGVDHSGTFSGTIAWD